MKAFFPATGAIDESSPMEGESQRDRSDRVQPLLSEKKKWWTIGAEFCAKRQIEMITALC